MRILNHSGGTFGHGNWNKSSRIVGRDIGKSTRIQGKQTIIWDNTLIEIIGIEE
jgi:hypothetical protein